MAFEQKQTWSRNLDVTGTVTGKLDITFNFRFADTTTLQAWNVTAVPTWDSTLTIVATNFAPGTPFPFPRNTCIRGTLACRTETANTWVVTTNDLTFGRLDAFPPLKESFMGGLVETTPVPSS
jgi:hypothetical protein